MDDDYKKDKEYHYFTYGKVPPRETEGTVEVTPARDLRPYPVQMTAAQPRPPRRSTFRTVLTSFLAGALVVGGLMFASDRMNLFSGEVVVEQAPVESQIQMTSSAGTTSAVTTAAVDIVRPNTISELVEIASPAVVKIETFANRSSMQGGNSRFSDEFFREFFGDFFEVPDQQPSQPNQGNLVQVGAGSGFFFDPSGYILTNEHVVHGATEVRVVVSGRKEPYKAKVLGTAYEMDLAVLKVEGEGSFPTLPMGNSENIRVGDWVVAIGNPYEFDHTVTVGVLSAKERTIKIPDSDGTRNYQTLLQTDASINPGNSGGPLLNLKGEVIGINTAVNAQAQGIGFAIPTSTVSGVLDSLKANKAIPRPYIGIRMGNVPQEYVADLGLKNTNGAFITEVLFGSPAYKAGLQVYDVVLAIDNQEIKDVQGLQKIVSGKKPGDELSLNVMRSKKQISIRVMVGDMNMQIAQ